MDDGVPDVDVGRVAGGCHLSEFGSVHHRRRAGVVEQGFGIGIQGVVIIVPIDIEEGEVLQARGAIIKGDT